MMEELIVGMLGLNLVVQVVLWRFAFKSKQAIHDVWDIIPGKPAPAEPNEDRLFQG